MIKKIKSFSSDTSFKKKIISELISNAIAWACALLTSQLLKSFLFVPKVENAFGIFNQHQKIKVSSKTFDILSWVIVFLAGLLVFTIVEYYTEKHLFKTYYKEKNNQN